MPTGFGEILCGSFRQEDGMAQFNVLMTRTVKTEYTIEAGSKQEAKAKAMALDFTDSGSDVETTDWDVLNVEEDD